MKRATSWAISLIFLCISAATAPGASSSHAPGEYRCGTEADRVITELFRHRQARVAGRAEALAAEEPRAPLPDIGNIAIVDDSEGAVVRPNPFDLRQRTVVLVPSGATTSRYTALAETMRFDSTAAERGAALAGLLDDDSRQVRLPFSFPFFGQQYEEVFINSDGNLTFTEPDTAISSRSLSRALSGPPRVFPFFEDLDPSQPESAVRLFSAADRVVATWDRVPQYSPRGIGPRQTFQVALYPDGRIEFHYQEITIDDAVVGIAPGRLRDGFQAANFSEGVTTPASGAIAEIFSSRSDVDVAVIAQKFYRNHDDVYDFLVLHNNMGLTVGPGAFAFLLHIRNQVRGIGNLLRQDPVFDFGRDFGSGGRLQSLLNLGPLANYPRNPNDVIPIFAATSRNTAITILGQESGHRFLAYPRFFDPLTNRGSLALLGRDNAHWSFFFNSDASVVEGNRIEDLGEGQSPRFRTVGTVERYSAFDQYLMGLRAPEETPASFLVRNPSQGFAGDAPRTGVTFDGARQDVSVQMIINAEGRRVPDATVAQKHFNYAFVLLVREGTQPTAEDLAQLDRLRLEWERFFNAAVDNRGTARTSLVRQLRLSTWPASGVLRGAPAPAAVSIAAPLARDLEVLLTAASGVITVPASVTIPAGRTSASFSITGNRQGVAELSARVTDPAYDVPRTVVQVREDASQLRLEAVSGANQRGGRGATLPEPVVVRLRDDNAVPFAGVAVTFTASGDGAVTPARALTDANGEVRVSWRLASSGIANTLVASLETANSVAAVVSATALDRPVFSAAGVVNAASFNTGAAAAQTAISPGSLVSIFGASLALETRTAGAFPLPISLGSTRVAVSGIAAPLIFVSPGQINLQIPFELSGPTAEIVISTPAGQSAPVVVPVGSAQPGIFFDPATGGGAVIHNTDGRLTTDRPARAGDFLQIFATGLGVVSPAVASGLAAPLSPLSRTVAQPQVLIAGRAAPVAFSGLAPGFAGLYQLTVQVPEGVSAGRQAVSLTVNGLRSNEVFVNLQ